MYLVLNTIFSLICVFSFIAGVVLLFVSTWQLAMLCGVVSILSGTLSRKFYIKDLIKSGWYGFNFPR